MAKHLKYTVITLWLFILSCPLSAQRNEFAAEAWADSVLSTMSLEQKVGQLYLLLADTNAVVNNELLHTYAPAGVLVENTYSAARLLAEMTFASAGIPLWKGLLTKEVLAPLEAMPQLADYKLLKAIQDTAMLTEYAYTLADQIRSLGIHLYISRQVDSTNNIPTQVARAVFRKEIALQWIDERGKIVAQPVAVAAPPVFLEVVSAANYANQLFRHIAYFYYNEEAQQLLEVQVRANLKAKYQYGVHLRRIQSLPESLRYRHEWLARRIQEQALTLVRNQDDVLPLRHLEKRSIAAVAIGHRAQVFHEMLARYAAVDAYNISVNTEESTLDALFAQLKAYNTLIISFGKASDQEELNNNLSTLLRKLSARTTLLKVLFHEVGSQEALEKDFRYQGVLLAHNATATAQDLAAQALFGAFAIRGKWAGQGIEAPSAGRLKFTMPEELGIDRHYIRLADSLAAQVVRSKAAPGCQVLAAKDAKVFYFKTFGYHTYDSLQPVKPDDIYDLASVTKISTSAAALMRLHDMERFQLDETWGRLDRRVRKSNKDSLTFRQLLIHRAGLAAWIPFWKNYVDTDGRLNSEIFSADSSGRYRDKVAEGIFIRRGFASRELIGSIVASPVDTKKNYVYSDLSYYMYPGMLRRLAGRSFERFLQEEFYHRLGANTLVFNPLQHFPRSRIVPTEYDSLFRKQLIHGTVHDEGAAMFGGISGHAGLFGHAIDVAKLMQMYLNKGIYGGERYLEAATIEEFTRCQFCPDERQNRQQRAIAFDKNRFVGNAPASASAASYGHSGFTGTFTWNEPENGLLFVFLSNRVYPTRNNNRISQYNFRTDLNEIFYQAIKYAYKVP